MIEFSEATSKDAKGIIEYLNIIGGQSNNITYGKNGCSLNEVQEMEIIKEIHESNNSVMIIAKDNENDKIVGIGSLKGNKHERLRHRANLGVSVLKDYWHQGIGTNLMSILVGYAIESIIEIIDLEVVIDNENAIALYEKFGFEIIGTYENFMKLDDHYVDVYLMNLYL